MSFDSKTNEVVLFGGRTATWTALADTWTWNGVTWAQQSPAVSPLARAYGGMVFDAALGVSVLYGGAVAYNQTAFLSDFWSYNSSTDTWVLLGSNQAPGPRVDQQLGYDPVRQQVVMFGGSTCNPTCVALGDTWTFNGSSWAQQAPAHSPSPRLLYRVAYDPNAGALPGGSPGGVVLFGGLVSANGASLNDTWAWNGTSWLEALGVASPPGSELFGMAYDTQVNQMVVVGGEGTALWPNTWTYTWSVPTLSQSVDQPPPGLYAQGAPVTFTVVVGDTSSQTMSDVTVSESLPVGLTAAGTTPRSRGARTRCASPR
jgi:hypothetical protein